MSDSTRIIRDDGLRRFAGYGMKRAFNAIQADVNATLKPHGLRLLSFSALVIVRDNPGLNQAQLASALSIERPNTVALTDALERDGWIERTRSETDRRAHALSLTEDGKRRLAFAARDVATHDQRMTQDLNGAERTTLDRALEAIERRGR